MARGGCNFKELEEFQKKLGAVTDNMSEILDICAKDLAQRLIAKVIKRTPVGQYDGASYVCASRLSHSGSKVAGKEGGTLKKAWTVKVYRSANACMIEIKNPMEYASYVENGHRTRGGKGWVLGHLMMKTSAEEIERDTPGILAMKLKKLMEAQLK